MSRKLSDEEHAAIAALGKLARKWPKTLRLYSWNGTLVVMDADVPPSEDAVFATILGIPNDGGDT